MLDFQLPCFFKKIFKYIYLILLIGIPVFENIDLQSNLDYQVYPIPGNINTQMQEFGPSITSDGKTLYFYSKRNSQYTDIYKSKLVNGKWTSPIEVKELNSYYDDQSPYIYGDERFIIFSSNRDGSIEFKLSNGQVGISRDLYYSEKVNGEWSPPASLSDLINTDEMEENPYLYGDYLYFTRYPFGNTAQAKIYRSKIVNNNFQEPEELPSPINLRNTSSISPFVSHDGSYLYFSSNRPGGNGGYDIYRSKILDNGGFGSAENLGIEINTEANEAYLIINPIDNSFIFCRKKQDENYDMYVAKKVKKEEDSIITIVPNFALNPLKPPKSLNINENKKDQSEKIFNFNLSKKNPNEEDKIIFKKKFEKDIENLSNAIKEKKKIVINSIYFDSNSPVLLKDSYPILNALTEILQNNKSIKIKIIGHTDLTGDLEENKKLSWDRADSVKNYLMNSGIDPSRILTEGKGSTQPIMNSKYPDANRVNRRTEFEIVE